MKEAKSVKFPFIKDKNLSLKIVFNNKIFRSFHEKASNLFTGKPNITGINFQRYMKGDALGPHKDDHEGHRENSQIVYCGLVLYYNDDYEGGELEYPDLNIVHKPKSRSLVIHSGNILHGTLPVKNDVTRYISTMFVKHQIGEEVFLNEKVFKDIKWVAN